MSGVSAIEVDNTTQVLPSSSQVLATFAIGLLAGYGSHKVFIWLDSQVERIFQVQSTTFIVPALSGKTKEEAGAILKAASLKLGEIQEEDTEETSQVGLVIDQIPAPGSSAAKDSPVNIMVGRRLQEKSGVPVPPPPTPDQVNPPAKVETGMAIVGVVTINGGKEPEGIA